MLNNEDKKFLELYSDSEYEKPSVTVDAVILRINSTENSNYRKLPVKKLQVFLNKRQYPPFKDQFAVVGTFINLDYELNETLKLCVKNKVNLEDFYYEQLFTFADKARDPRTRVLSVSYMLLTNKEQELQNGDWFDISFEEVENSLEKLENGYKSHKKIKISLSNNNTTLNNIIEVTNLKQGIEETKNVTIKQNELAFDHIKIIYYALERLKNKLEYTDIIFNLLPNEFTLTELKQCYEIILQKPLLDANFRRKTAKMVSPISKYVEGKGHRTSQLFTHNPSWEIINLD